MIPQVVEASDALEQARTARSSAVGRQLRDRAQLTGDVFQHYLPGQAHHGGVARYRDHWQERTSELREHLAQIEALPPSQSAALIRQRHADAEAVARAQAQRQEQLRSIEHEADRHTDRDSGHGLGR